MSLINFSCSIFCPKIINPYTTTLDSELENDASYYKEKKKRERETKYAEYVSVKRYFIIENTS